MSNAENIGDLVTAVDAPEVITIKIAGHENEHQIQRQILMDSTTYFRGMFEGAHFKEAVTGRVILREYGQEMDKALWVVLRFFAMQKYSMRDYILDTVSNFNQQFCWIQMAAFALDLHELWLDVFVLVDQFGNKDICKQVVQDLTDIIGIFLVGMSSHWPVPYSDIHPVIIVAPLFRKVHYDRILNRMENSYPTDLHGLWLQAMRGFYYTGINTQDRTFIDMAHENPSLAVRALEDHAAILTSGLGPARAFPPRLQVDNRPLYDLLFGITSNNIRNMGTISQAARDAEWPNWFLRA